MMTNGDFEEFIKIVGHSTPVEVLLAAANDRQVQQKTYRRVIQEEAARASRNPDVRAKKCNEVAMEARERLATLVGSMSLEAADVDVVMGIAEDIFWSNLDRYVY